MWYWSRKLLQCLDSAPYHPTKEIFHSASRSEALNLHVVLKLALLPVKLFFAENHSSFRLVYSSRRKQTRFYLTYIFARGELKEWTLSKIKIIYYLLKFTMIDGIVSFCKILPNVYSTVALFSPIFTKKT